MNDLERYFLTNRGRKTVKLDHYFEIYDRYFSRFRGREACVLEIGVKNGGSLQMWKEYFGPEARIFGLDINPDCKEFEEEQIHIFIGDQEDKAFLESVAQSIPRIDVLIDDGGHSMQQQINTFETLFPHIDPNGIYLCEDVCTSYWSEYGGGYRRDGTYVEYAKNFVDYVNAWHSTEKDRLDTSDFTRSVVGVYFHDSIVVVEKGPKEAPRRVTSGKGSLHRRRPATLLGRLTRPLRRFGKED